MKSFVLGWNDQFHKWTSIDTVSIVHFMGIDKRVRNWMKTETRSIPSSSDRKHRPVQSKDAEELANLMYRSYQGTTDYEGETPTQCLEEMRSTFNGKYGAFLDFASFAIADGDKLVSASLVTLWKEKPLLAFSMTDPANKGQGLAGFLVERSISALAERGYSDFYLVVTEGNTSAERLYRRLGFVSLDPSVPKQR